MNTLMLHCGANAVTRQELAALPAPKSLGPRHNPLPFIEDVELVATELQKHGLYVESDRYGVTQDKDGNPARFFGLMELQHEALDHALVVGLRGSYDQSISRGLAVGSRVFVCDNLGFSGEVTYHTKQTTHIADRLPRMIAEASMKVPQLAKLQERRFDAYRTTQLDPSHGDAALVEMLRRGVLHSQNLLKAVAEWDNPTHEEHAQDGFTVWRLMQATTEALKARDPEKANVIPVWDRTIEMTRFLDEVVAL